MSLSKKSSDFTAARKAKKIGVVATAALSVMMLAACGGGSGEASAPSPDAEAEYQDFSFTSWYYGEEAQKPLLEDEAQSFTEGKDISVDFSSYPFAEYRNQVLLRSRSNDIAGVAQVDIADLNSFAQLGNLVDLSSYVEGAGYTEAALKTGQVDGKQLGLPWYTGSIGLVSNSALLEEAGVSEAPVTVEEFEAALRAVDELGPDYVPYALATKPEQVKDFIPWFKTFGSKIVDGETIAVNDEGAVEALTWLKGLLDDELISLNVGRPEARTLFAQEMTAFFDDANQVRGTIKDQASDPALAEATVPVARPVVEEGDTPQSLTWGGLLVVFDNGSVQTAADFASYVSSDPEIALTRYEQIGSAPTVEEALEDPAFAEDAYSTAWQESITNSAEPNPLWQFENYAQMESILATQIQAALTGQSSPQDALDAAAEEMQALVG
ncbi:sugar ABC transporter substrate-binding protein [Arthrobacter tecti]